MSIGFNGLLSGVLGMQSPYSNVSSPFSTGGFYGLPNPFGGYGTQGSVFDNNGVFSPYRNTFSSPLAGLGGFGGLGGITGGLTGLGGLGGFGTAQSAFSGQSLLSSLLPLLLLSLNKPKVAPEMKESGLLNTEASNITEVQLDRWFRTLAKEDAANDPTKASQISKEDLAKRIADGTKSGSKAPFATFFKDNFDAADTNKDGLLTKTEVLAAKDKNDKSFFTTQSAKLSQGTFDSWFTKLAERDAKSGDKNKTISVADVDAQLAEAKTQKAEAPLTNYLKNNFTAIDSNKDGELTQEEVKAAKNSQGTVAIQVG